MTLYDETQKVEHEHKFAVRRIWLEKGLLACVVIIFSIGASVVLENFKDGLVDRRHTLEMHERILGDLRRAYGELANHTYKAAHTEKNGDARRAEDYAEILADYRRALDQFGVMVNVSGRHFSQQLEDRLQQHIWFHEAIAFKHVMIEKTHWGFAVTVFLNFGSLTRTAVSGEKIEVATTGANGGFGLIGWTKKQILEKKAGAYFNELHAKWMRENP